MALEGKHLSPLIDVLKQNDAKSPFLPSDDPKRKFCSLRFFSDKYGNHITFDHVCMAPSTTMELLEKGENGALDVRDTDRGDLWYCLYKDEEKNHFVLSEFKISMGYSKTYLNHVILDDLEPLKTFLTENYFSKD